MKARAEFVTRLFVYLTRLYPLDFRQQFGEEMRLVFEDAVTEAASHGVVAVAGLFLREICDWPLLLLREYWSSSRTNIGRLVMSDVVSHQEWTMDSRRQVLISALPPVLLGLGIALSSLIIRDPWYAVPSWRLGSGIIAGLVPVGVLAVGGLLALVKRLPDWGYTWAAFAVMGLAFLIMTLADERADEGAYLISATGDIVVGLLLVLGMFVLLAVAALRGWRQAGLVSIGFAALAGLSVYSAVTAAPFSRYDLALLAAPAGLLIAGLIHAYCVRDDVGRIAVMLGLGLLNASGIWMANNVWQPWLLVHDRPSPALPMLVLFTGMLVTGPFIGAFWHGVKRSLRRT